MNLIFVTSLVLAALISSNLACKSPPTLPPRATWVPNQGCPSGGVYFTSGSNRQRCHCWGFCGYICEPTSSGGGGGGTGGGSGGGGGGSGPGGSPCPFGGVYFNGKGQRCHCQSFNKQPYYVCEDNTTTTTTTTTSKPPTAGNDTSSGNITSSGNNTSSGNATKLLFEL